MYSNLIDLVVVCLLKLKKIKIYSYNNRNEWQKKVSLIITKMESFIIGIDSEIFIESVIKTYIKK